MRVAMLKRGLGGKGAGRRTHVRTGAKKKNCNQRKTSLLVKKGCQVLDQYLVSAHIRYPEVSEFDRFLYLFIDYPEV